MIQVFTTNDSAVKIAKQLDQNGIIALTGSETILKIQFQKIKQSLSELWGTEIVSITTIDYPLLQFTIIYDINTFSCEQANKETLSHKDQILSKIDNPFVIGGMYSKNNKGHYQLLKYDWDGNVEIKWLDTDQKDKTEFKDSIFIGVLPSDNDVIKINFFGYPDKCYWCKKDINVLGGISVITNDDKYIKVFQLDEHADIISRLLQNDTTKKLLQENNVGEIKPRFSKTSQESYTSNGCIQCDGLYGRFYLYEGMLDHLVTDSLPRTLFQKEMTYKELVEITKNKVILQKSNYRYH